MNESVWTLGSSVRATTIGTPNNTVTFGTLWDANYLYVGIKALDSSLYNDSATIYDDDSFDIYIDANHNKGTSYDSFDRQFQVGYNDATLVEKNNNTTGVLSRDGSHYRRLHRRARNSVEQPWRHACSRNGHRHRHREQ